MLILTPETAMRSLCICALLAFPLAAADRVYQTNSAGDAVDIIDPATNKIVMRVTGIEAAHGVTFSPDGTRAYLTCEADKTLWTTDTRTGKLLSKVPLSGHPNNLAVTNDGSRVFVGIREAPGAVDVIDTKAQKNIKSVPVKGAVHNVYVTPDGRYAVAGSIEGKMLTVIDARTLEVAWEMPFDAGIRPIAFEKGADGAASRMFVQLSGVHGFAVVDFKTRKETSRVQLPNDPHDGHAESGAPAHGILVAPDNRSLWVNSSVASSVFVYSLPDLRYLGHVKVGEVPDWSTFTPDGKRLYVANAGSNSVSVIDTAARSEITRIPVGEVPKRNAAVRIP
jgi:YVTN family beta-propeller protein